MIEVPPFAIWGLFSAAVVAGIFYIARVSRDNHTAKVTEVKQREADTSTWRSGFREVVVNLRTEMVRGQIPSDWFPTFETSIPILSRVAATMPDGIEPQKRAEIIGIVDQLCTMSAGDGGQAVYGAQKVVDMLRRLEELTDDA